MKDKINIAKLLKDCPSGMELDCLMYEGVVFDCIANEDILPIRCCIRNPKGGYNVCHFTEYGCWSNVDSAKCVIFPKGKTTWEGFQKPFKDGDIVFYNDTIAIFKEWGDETLFRTHVTKYLCCDYFIDTNVPLFGKSVRKEIRFANEEEKQSLFDAIKANGYKWNEETKTLEELVEPMFKINNIIRHKERKSNTRIVDIKDGNYIFENGDIMPIYLQNDYEFTTDKFDINTLKPFDKVLIRDNDIQEWCISFFCHCNGLVTYKYSCINGSGFAQCIPYEGNEHLRGTTNDCDDFYKIW